MPSRGGQRYDRSDSGPPVQGLPILYERSSFPHNRFESPLVPIFSHVLRDGSGVASSRKELCGCQAGAASGTTAPTPGRPYRAYRFFTNEAHFRINRFESQLFPIFSHVLRDGSGVASSGKELSGCQAGAASGTTAPTPGRPYRAYRFFTNEAHFRITDSSHNLFPFFHTFYATAAV